MLIVPDNLFTYMDSDRHEFFISLFPAIAIDLALSDEDLITMYHVAAKTFLSYEGVDL